MKRNNRTWLCTVLFMDIVDYSKLSVDMQMLVKQSFSTLVSDALKNLPDEDCIKLDTGDGVALCYLGAEPHFHVLKVDVVADLRVNALIDGFLDAEEQLAVCRPG